MLINEVRSRTKRCTDSEHELELDCVPPELWLCDLIDDFISTPQLTGIICKPGDNKNAWISQLIKLSEFMFSVFSISLIERAW